MIPDGRPSPNGAGAPGTDGEHEREDELAAVLDAYLAEVEAGRPVDPEEWVRRHPAIAGRLRACLRGLHLVEAAAEALDITPGASVGIDRSRSGLEPTAPGPMRAPIRARARFGADRRLRGRPRARPRRHGRRLRGRRAIAGPPGGA